MWRYLRINTAHLYEIRENRDKFDLYFRKKKGMKFKKQFDVRYYAEEFAILYLRHCCLSCQQRGWVYKVRGLRNIVGMRASNEKFVGNENMFCPECHTRHHVRSTVELSAQIER